MNTLVARGPQSDTQSIFIDFYSPNLCDILLTKKESGESMLNHYKISLIAFHIIGNNCNIQSAT